jgi:hypothetical protein
VEDRYSWLPAGLESARWEPDDRASQRGKSARGEASDRDPAASGQDPYDQDRPESKLGKSKETGRSPESEQGRKSEARKPASHEWTEVQADEDRPEPETRKGKDPQPREEKPRRQEREPKPQAAKTRQQPQSDARSTVDAMGQEKHRQVVGQRFGASRARQLAYYGIFIAFVVAAYIGLKAAADQLDKAPAHDRDQAPWSEQGAPQGPLGGFEVPGHKGPTRFQ